MDKIMDEIVEDTRMIEYHSSREFLGEVEIIRRAVEATTREELGRTEQWLRLYIQPKPWWLPTLIWRRMLRLLIISREYK